MGTVLPFLPASGFRLSRTSPCLFSLFYMDVSLAYATAKRDCTGFQPFLLDLTLPFHKELLFSEAYGISLTKAVLQKKAEHDLNAVRDTTVLQVDTCPAVFSILRTNW